MIIFYLVETGEIINTYPGFPDVTVLGGRAVVEGRVLLNDVKKAGWKYVEDQVLEETRTGYRVKEQEVPALIRQKSVVEEITELKSKVALLTADVSTLKSDTEKAR